MTEEETKVVRYKYVVICNDDDAAYGATILRLPLDIINSTHGQLVIRCITTGDARYGPMSHTEKEKEKNESFYAEINATIAHWRRTYSLQPGFSNDVIVVGTLNV